MVGLGLKSSQAKVLMPVRRAWSPSPRPRGERAGVRGGGELRPIIRCILLRPYE